MRQKVIIMELSTNTIKLENAIQILEENMKKKNRVLPASMRKSLLKLLNNYSDLVTVKGKKIIISTQFYPAWIQEHKLDKDTEEIDVQHYKFFRKLSKYGYIHAKSSYFPKKLAVITLNPTLPSLYKGNLKEISRYKNAKKSLHCNKFSKINLPEMISLAFIDLRFFQNIKFTEREIKSINTSNIIFVNKSTAYLYLEDKGIFDNTTIPPYQMISIKGKKLVKILKKFQKSGIVYPFKDTDFEKGLSLYRQEYFPNMKMQEIRHASNNNILMQSSPLLATLAGSRKIMSAITIAELHSLYPSAIPQHLIDIESARISEALNRTKDTDDGDTFIDSSFSLEEFEYFDELLKTKNSSSFMKKKEPAKRELLQYSSLENPETHGILITKYIAHLLESVNGDKKTRKIVISTFRNYYSLVRKHLFENIEDLSSVQAHEINVILQNLAINKYKDASIASVRSRITDFFTFHGKQNNVIPMNLASYPKSLVFEHEIDPILLGIDDMYNRDLVKLKALQWSNNYKALTLIDFQYQFIEFNKKSNNVEQGVDTEYKILRDKAIVLIAKYSGLRKNDLRSRLIKDVYIYGNKLCIYVNSEGLKKLDLRLKTSSAKRRVCVKIIDKDHLEIINDYIEQRENLKTKNKFFFLDISEKKPVVVKEAVFNKISKVIQKVTKRYTSFHSLRHTFATYSVKEILECKKVNPYKMIDLAIKMGHTSPEITLKKYTHRSVIEDILTNKDNK